MWGFGFESRMGWVGRDCISLVRPVSLSCWWLFDGLCAREFDLGLFGVEYRHIHAMCVSLTLSISRTYGTHFCLLACLLVCGVVHDALWYYFKLAKPASTPVAFPMLDAVPRRSFPFPSLPFLSCSFRLIHALLNDIS